jgi:hypothetical protein
MSCSVGIIARAFGARHTHFAVVRVIQTTFACFVTGVEPVWTNNGEDDVALGDLV